MAPTNETDASIQRIFGFFDDWPPVQNITCTSLAGQAYNSDQDDKQWWVDVPGNDSYLITLFTVDGTYTQSSLYVPVGQNKYLTPDACTKVGS